MIEGEVKTVLSIVEQVAKRYAQCTINDAVTLVCDSAGTRAHRLVARYYNTKSNSIAVRVNLEPGHRAFLCGISPTHKDKAHTHILPHTHTHTKPTKNNLRARASDLQAPSSSPRQQHIR